MIVKFKKIIVMLLLCVSTILTVSIDITSADNDLLNDLNISKEKLLAFNKWESYIAKVTLIIPYATFDQLLRMNWKLNSADTTIVDNKKLVALINYLSAAVAYEIYIRSL